MCIRDRNISSVRDELSLVRNQNLHNVTERILIARDANNEVELETFCSENRRVDPTQFLNRVREFDRFNGSSWEVELIKILKCFKGNSEIWAETHRNEWERYEDFEKAFRNKYWSEEELSLIHI